MTVNAETKNLQIHVMKKSQYDAIEPSTNQLYFVEYDGTTVFVKSVGDTAPSPVVNGDKYVNTVTKLIYTYDSGSWDDGEELSEDTLYIEDSNNVIYVYDGTNVRQVGGSSGTAANVDGVTTSLNSSNQLQAIGVINKNGNSPKYDWVGTKTQYEALQSYNDNWIYYIVDPDATSGNMSLNNVFQRLNAAWAWQNNGSVVFTVPSPVAGFKTYSNPSNMTISSTITDWNGETSITDGNGTYTRDTVNDTVFGSIAPDSKTPFLTVYDLLTAIKG